MRAGYSPEDWTRELDLSLEAIEAQLDQVDQVSGSAREALRNVRQLLGIAQGSTGIQTGGPQPTNSGCSKTKQDPSSDH